jgi:hypothetical protein
MLIGVKYGITVGEVESQHKDEVSLSHLVHCACISMHAVCTPFSAPHTERAYWITVSNQFR